jgi:hypothetical protein
MIWTCKHCERWHRDGCTLGRKVFPRGGPDACRDFYRAPGSDDDLPETVPDE